MERWFDRLIECSLDFSGPPVVPDVERASRQFEPTSDWPPTEGQCLVYRLSSQGADLWEHLARPDWSKFLVSSVGEHSNQWTLTGTDRDLVKTWRTTGSKIGGGFPVPLEGTEEWEILKPWKATYWKILPLGCRLKFEFKTWKRPLFPTPEEVEDAFRFQNEIWRRWHKSFEAICDEHFRS